MKASVATVGLAALLLGGCATAVPEASLTVAATIYPLSDVAKIVGGAVASVKIIVPNGAEPHEFEPSPRDIAAMLDADVLLLNGGGIDDWAKKVAVNARQKGATVLVMSDELTFIPSEEEGSPADPHFWLDPQKTSAAGLVIAEGLAKAKPENAEGFRIAAKDYERMLMALDEEFTQGLSSCASRTAIVSHAAFGYLAKRYNLKLLPIVGLSPEEEPSAKALADLVTLARRENVRAVYFESLVSPRVAETVASELGLQALSLNPLEGLTDEEERNGGTYLTVMRKNLAALKTGLRCP